MDFHLAQSHSKCRHHIDQALDVLRNVDSSTSFHASLELCGQLSDQFIHIFKFGFLQPFEEVFLLRVQIRYLEGCCSHQIASKHLFLDEFHDRILNIFFETVVSSFSQAVLSEVTGI